MASLETLRIIGAQLVGPDSPTVRREDLYASITPGTAERWAVFKLIANTFYIFAALKYKILKLFVIPGHSSRHSTMQQKEIRAHGDIGSTLYNKFVALRTRAYSILIFLQILFCVSDCVTD